MIALVAVWFAGLLTVPIAKILTGTFSAEEMLFVRSLPAFIVSFAIVGGRVWKADWRVKLAGPIIGFSSIGFYRAIQIWDISPVMVVLTLMPVVNMAIAAAERRPVSMAALGNLIVLAIGIYLGLDPRDKPINHAGLCWVISCSVASGIGFELWSKSPHTTTVSERCFWVALPLLLVTPIIIGLWQGPFVIEKFFTARAIALLSVFGVLNGIVYTYGTIIPFSTFGKMNTVAAAVLLQGTTPFTIVGSWLFVKEKLAARQWLGVLIALSGAITLSYLLAKRSKEVQTAASSSR